MLQKTQCCAFILIAERFRFLGEMTQNIPTNFQMKTSDYFSNDEFEKTWKFIVLKTDTNVTMLIYEKR